MQMQSTFEATMMTCVSSVTPSPFAPKSTTLKTVSCDCVGAVIDCGDGGRGELLLGLTGTLGLVLRLGWYGFWSPLLFCLLEPLLFAFPFLLTREVEGALFRLQCLPVLASHI
jgi:hypothetical protein